MIKNRDTLITKYLYFLYKIYKEGELNTRCDMFLRYSEGDIPLSFENTAKIRRFVITNNLCDFIDIILCIFEVMPLHYIFFLEYHCFWCNQCII